MGVTKINYGRMFRAQKCLVSSKISNTALPRVVWTRSTSNYQNFSSTVTQLFISWIDGLTGLPVMVPLLFIYTIKKYYIGIKIPCIQLCLKVLCFVSFLQSIFI